MSLDDVRARTVTIIILRVDSRISMFTGSRKKNTKSHGNTKSREHRHGHDAAEADERSVISIADADARGREVRAEGDGIRGSVREMARTACRLREEKEGCWTEPTGFGCMCAQVYSRQRRRKQKLEDASLCTRACARDR